MPTDRPDLLSRLLLRRLGDGFEGSGLPLAAIRAQLDRPVLPRAILRRGLASVSDIVVPGASGALPARLYRPHRSRGLVMFLHGGGFVLCGLDSHEDIACRLARASGAAVVSVAYRLAPEHPFPAAPEDAFAAYRFLADATAELGPGRAGIAVAGDSAGGNLAAAVARMARDAGVRPPALQVLFYPPTLGRERTASADEFGRGFFLTADAISWFRSQYVPVDDEVQSPLYAPALADDLAGLAPALIVTAGCDPLRDEGELYAVRLRDAGVPCRDGRVRGALHGFLNFAPFYPPARRVLREAGQSIRRALDGVGLA